MNRLLWSAIALVTVAPLLGAQERSTDREFRWEGALSSGRTIYVRNMNGGIRVERASGGEVQVLAEKSWRRGNPADVRIEVTRIGSGGQDVLVCAWWRQTTDCDEQGYRTDNDRGDRWRDRNDDVAVEFTVRVPAGVRLDITTVNGGLEIRGATSVVEASTVNGGIRAESSGGPVNASTVNGDIEVRMGDSGNQNLSFETVNGSIEVYVPDGLNADVEMQTVNGRVGSDFPMTLSGRINPRRIRATIGSGGRRISLETVNGSVELRKS
jgi:hypothetical protein